MKAQWLSIFIKRAWFKNLVISSIAVAGLAAGLSECFVACSKPADKPVVAKKVVVNEAARTLLYLPIYHALEQGYFKDNGLDVTIITGGTATNAFAAMVSGEADFAVADPMYVPISREKGSQTKVVAQIVARIALWGVTWDPQVTSMDAATLKGKKITTHPRPMTAYTYTVKSVQDAGLDPEKDVEIIQSQPGTEVVPFLDKKADFLVTIEPNVSKAVAAGGHIVLSYPQVLGDQIFTGMMTRQDLLTKDSAEVQAMVDAVQMGMTDIRQNRAGALATAKKYFNQLPDSVVTMALNRLIDDQVIPSTVLVSDSSWDKAIAVRVGNGDLKSASPRDENCAVGVMGMAK